MKKARAIFTAAVMAAAVTGACGIVWADTDITLQINSPVVSVNGIDLNTDQPPVIVNGRTLVPVRVTVEAMGGTAEWDAETKTAVLTREDTEVQLTVNSTSALLNGETQSLDTAPVIINGRTMLPLRFIAESFGFDTEWDAETKTIYLYGGEEFEEEYEYDDYDDDFEEYSYDEVGTDGSIFTFSPGGVSIKPADGTGEEWYDAEDITTWYYKDSKGGMCSLTGEGSDKMVFKTAAGRSVTIYHDGSDAFEIGLLGKGSDGFLYYSDSLSLTAKTAAGKIAAKYDFYEMRDLYKDSAGKEAACVYSKDGTTANGFLYPDGSFVEFRRLYEDTFIGSDENTYCFSADTMAILDSEYVQTAELPLEDIYILLNDDNGYEYTVSNGNDGHSYILTAPDGSKAVMVYDEGDVDPDFAMICTDEWGNKYGFGMDQTLVQFDEKGYILNYFKVSGYCNAYKDKDGGVYRWIYDEENDLYTIERPDGSKTALTRTYG